MVVIYSCRVNVDCSAQLSFCLFWASDSLGIRWEINQPLFLLAVIARGCEYWGPLPELRQGSRMSAILQLFDVIQLASL